MVGWHGNGNQIVGVFGKKQITLFLPSLKSMSMDKREVEGKKVGETVVTL